MNQKNTLSRIYFSLRLRLRLHPQAFAWMRSLATLLVSEDRIKELFTCQSCFFLLCKNHVIVAIATAVHLCHCGLKLCKLEIDLAIKNTTKSREIFHGVMEGQSTKKEKKITCKMHSLLFTDNHSCVPPNHHTYSHTEAFDMF